MEIARVCLHKASPIWRRQEISCATTGVQRNMGCELKKKKKTWVVPKLDTAATFLRRQRRSSHIVYSLQDRAWISCMRWG